MAFDSTTRNKLATLVTRCRGRLVEEFSDQFQQFYGIVPKEGSVADLASLTHLDESQRETARQLHEIVDYYAASHTGSEAQRRKDAIDRLLREQAFTVLNRLAALRMAEERGIVQECVRQGMKSDGFVLFEMNAGTDLGEPHDRYVVYLECLYDELSLDLGVLFDRFSPHGLLFPGSSGLKEVLDFLGDDDIKHLWAEDETIGWIYQYWNSKEERKAMRDASAAPRNSRELAVRNQFFTPRYVVEFLTDNTLGRIWYEMTQGETRLVDQCRYLVRRPTEIFLAEGEEAPGVLEGNEESLSQEGLLKQPVHIPFRPDKDPREFRLLDPACGSMHFGLYAFDLFEVIYEEAWDKGHCPSLQEAYPEKADYLRDVPRLIIEHNIHGVDIDPRAVQIAGLSLWLRAQKTWKDIPAAERPRVRRSNIVCAEPMPGSDAMLEDFVQTLDPPLLGEFVKTVFDKMQLAGEAGTLLKIEEEIRAAIDEARERWEKLGAADRDLFTTEELNQTLRPGTQQELTGIEQALTADLRPLTTDFFDTAEERIYAALRDYAESAEAGDYQRRLFAEDAADGFAFIDLCRKRYDAVVMNPPFGDWTTKFKAAAKKAYPNSYNDILAAFVERGGQMLCERSRIGAITSRACFFLTTFRKWRENVVLRLLSPQLLVDLGHGVMDAAMVEAAAYVLQASEDSTTAPMACYRLLDVDDPSEVLGDVIRSESSALSQECSHWLEPSSFLQIPKAPFAYWVSERIRKFFSALEPLEESGRDVQSGASTMDDFRFLRLAWETSLDHKASSREETKQGKRWVTLAKGGSFSRYHIDWELVLDWEEDGRSLKAHVSEYRGRKGWGYHWAAAINGHSEYFRPGLTWPRRTQGGLSVRTLPRGSVFGDKGPAIFAPNNDHKTLWALLAITNSLPFRGLVSLQMSFGSYEVGVLERTPIPELTEGCVNDLSELARRAWRLQHHIHAQSQVDHDYISIDGAGENESLSDLAAKIQDDDRGRATELAELQAKIDEVAFQHFGFEASDRREFESDPQESEDDGTASSSDDEEENSPRLAGEIVEYLIGAALGRWDIRYATGERQPPELPDPFDPLPVCPPGMLQNTDGLPAAQSDVPDDYPLPITWPGILVSDPGHPEDIVARVRDALAVIWGDRSAAIGQEACEILGIKSGDLRDYFAEKKSGGKFFKDHLKRYSKSRRLAPIYWPLSTESGSYTLWVYYHRLTSDTLYTVVSKFVEPKIESVSRDLSRLTAKGDERTKNEEDDWERLTDLSGELQVLRDELLRVANLPWKPNLNDGVQITAAPLWNLFRLNAWQKKLKDTWQKLENGDYDWAHQAHTLWPERVIPKCATDRSLAIAHGYEADLWEEITDAKGKTKWQPKAGAAAITERLVEQHQN